MHAASDVRVLRLDRGNLHRVTAVHLDAAFPVAAAAVNGDPQRPHGYVQYVCLARAVVGVLPIARDRDGRGELGGRARDQR